MKLNAKNKQRVIKSKKAKQVNVTEHKLTEEMLKRSEEASRRLAKENAIMAEIGRILSSTLNIEEVYEQFAKEVAKLVPFDRIAINLRNLENNTVTVAYVAGFDVPNRRPGNTSPFAGSIIEFLEKNRSTLFIQIKEEKDIQKFSSLFPNLLSHFQSGVRSLISTPLIVKDTVIGVLHLRSFTPDTYDETDVKLIEKVGNQIAGAIANAQLFIENKRMVEALRQSEERHRTVLENIEDGYYEVDLSGNFTFFNDAVCRMLGYSREEMVGMGNKQYTDEENRKILFQAFNEVYRTGVPKKGFDWEVIRKDGAKVFGDASVSLIKDSNGQPIGFRGVARDITERKRFEEALARSEERYRTLVEESFDGIFLQKGYEVIFANRRLHEMLGYEQGELAGIDHWLIYHPDYQNLTRERAQARLRGESPPSTYEVKFLRKDGSSFWGEINAKVINFLGEPGIQVWARDIGEKKLAEEKMTALQDQLRQSQKMEAIGGLAGGIAHDFNNLLTVIKGYAELSCLGLDKNDPLWGNLEEIRKASERASNLTRQLLAFSRRQILEFKVINLNTLIKDIDKMLHRILGEDIELAYHLTQDIGRIKTDPGQIEQVILNLTVNARDAMPSGGKLTIETLNVELDEAYARSHMGVSPGQYLMLSVSDTGAGMDSKIRERIFEPFFTTKEKGKGTGLGLSMVYGIVKQSGGHIYVYSEPGLGTTFKIYLPRVEEAEDLQQKDSGLSPSGGNETILLVEDEPSVRDLAARILRDRGYQVYEALDGKDAFNMARKHPERNFHLLLTDVVMPGMSGKELSDRLILLIPDLKVLFISGYTDNAIVHHGVLMEGVEFLQKPFTPEALTRKVREVLDR
jgi:PAS domain S-box-containing protein